MRALDLARTATERIEVVHFWSICNIISSHVGDRLTDWYEKSQPIVLDPWLIEMTPLEIIMRAELFVLAASCESAFLERRAYQCHDTMSLNMVSNAHVLHLSDRFCIQRSHVGSTLCHLSRARLCSILERSACSSTSLMHHDLKLGTSQPAQNRREENAIEVKVGEYGRILVQKEFEIACLSSSHGIFISG